MIINHKHKFSSIILAAGKGTRMVSHLPKVMHKLAGQPLIAHVLDAVAPLHPEKAVLVIAPDMEDVRKAASSFYANSTFAIQDKQFGTGHAVRCAEKELGNGYAGTILILYGDTPLISSETLLRMLDASTSADVVVLGMHLDDPTGYGRLITDAGGRLEEIVECRDATPEQKRVTLGNSGVMAVHGRQLFPLLSRIEPNNAAGEYYLTDIVAEANQANLHCRVVTADAGELLGINSREQLAEAEEVVQKRLRRNAMAKGATLVDPETVYFSSDTKLGKDVIIQPNVVFLPEVVVEDGAEIRSFSHLEGARVKAGATVGPFARLRPGAVIGEEAHVGNFVEVKKSTLARGAKANHLSYIGDAEVGEGANIGAGTITCNYDGINKHKTVIGDHAFIGSNTSLVAPVTVGAGAIIGAGSVITEDVDGDALAIARGKQVSKAGKAKELRLKNRKS